MDQEDWLCVDTESFLNIRITNICTSRQNATINIVWQIQRKYPMFDILAATQSITEIGKRWPQIAPIFMCHINWGDIASTEHYLDEEIYDD